MRYISTRGAARAAQFGEVLLTGTAPDEGLYVPEEWPSLRQDDIRAFSKQSYGDVAASILGRFVGDAFAPEELRADIDAAYATFTHRAVAPLSQLGPNLFLLELFHGPTLSFKDVAMQLLARLFARALEKRGRRATVLVATSGDTGAAAIAAFRGAPNIDVVVLHPRGRISEVQRRQMTTVAETGIHNIALEGSFDEAQALVKALFADAAFAEAHHLTAVNSINFARIAAQCVYYFTAAAALGAGHGRLITFVVPTGNFGDAFAGEAAWRMGLGLERIIIATNANDALVRALATGTYATEPVRATLSPAMDIQLASNFERALFEASHRDAGWLTEAMRVFASSGRLGIVPQALSSLRKRYLAASVSDADTLATMASVYKESGRFIDPHTAVAVTAAAKAAASGPVVALATAHAAKFPQAVERAIGVKPPVPESLVHLHETRERYDIVPNKLATLKAYIKERVRPA